MVQFPRSLRLLISVFIAAICMLMAFVAGVQGRSHAPTELNAVVFDQAIDLLNRARARFQSVQDYQCIMTTKERVNGRLLPEQLISMKVRNRPFSVAIHWFSPASCQGQDVCYVEGKNGGRMRVHPPGWLGYFGYFNIDLTDPRVMEQTRHPLTHAGIGYLLDSTAKYWDMERRLGQTQLRLAETELFQRRCTLIETVHPNRQAGAFYAFRCLLYLDNETLLPVRMEAYDWPRLAGDPKGDLLECYTFRNCACNVGLTDKDFDK